MIVGMGPVEGEPVVRLAAVEQSAVKLLPLSRSRTGLLLTCRCSSGVSAPFSQEAFFFAGR